MDGALSIRGMVPRSGGFGRICLRDPSFRIYNFSQINLIPGDIHVLKHFGTFGPEGKNG